MKTRSSFKHEAKWHQAKASSRVHKSPLSLRSRSRSPTMPHAYLSACFSFKSAQSVPKVYPSHSSSCTTTESCCKTCSPSADVAGTLSLKLPWLVGHVGHVLALSKTKDSGSKCAPQAASKASRTVCAWPVAVAATASATKSVRCRRGNLSRLSRAGLVTRSAALSVSRHRFSKFEWGLLTGALTGRCFPFKRRRGMGSEWRPYPFGSGKPHMFHVQRATCVKSQVSPHKSAR